MRTTSVSQAIFAAILVALGILGLIKPDFAMIWQPIPKGMPAREVVAYLCSFITLACGIGLLWRSTAALAARVLLASLLLWLLLVRVPGLFLSFTVGIWWSAAKTLVIAGVAWVLYVGSATDWDRQRLVFATGDTGLRIARGLYGVGWIPLGLAHFIYLDATTVLVPKWLPLPATFWAYFTGGAYIVAGVAVAIGVLGWLAAALSALETGLITLLVWVPIAVAGHPTPFQWGEIVVSVTLTLAAWVVADSYRSKAGS